MRPLAWGFISLLATAGVVFSGVPVPAKLLVLLVISVIAYRALAKPTAHVIRLDPAGSSVLDGARGALVGEAVTGAFVALRLTTPDQRSRRAFIFFDELEPEAFRALLVHLRQG